MLLPIITGFLWRCKCLVVSECLSSRSYHWYVKAINQGRRSTPTQRYYSKLFPPSEFSVPWFMVSLRTSQCCCALYCIRKECFLKKWDLNPPELKWSCRLDFSYIDSLCFSVCTVHNSIELSDYLGSESSRNQNTVQLQSCKTTLASQAFTRNGSAYPCMGSKH